MQTISPSPKLLAIPESTRHAVAELIERADSSGISVMTLMQVSVALPLKMPLGADVCELLRGRELVK